MAVPNAFGDEPKPSIDHGQVRTSTDLVGSKLQPLLFYGLPWCLLQVRWTLAVYEFLDTDQFSNLDTLMLQLAPRQCLLSLDADAAKGKPRGDMAKVRSYLCCS